MVSLSSHEDKMITDLTEGLALAVNRHSGLDRSAFQRFSKTKLNKIFYYAIKEFSLPVTHSWYLAGAYIPAKSVSINNLKNAYHSGQISNQRGSYDEQNLGSAQFAKFFKKKIDDVWFTSRYEFLKIFYKNHAPERYKNLYLQSLNLRILLNDAKEELETIAADTGQTSFSQFVDNSSQFTGYRDRVSQRVESIEIELAVDDELNEASPCVKAFFDFLIGVVEDLQSTTDLADEHLEIFSNITRFYFMQTWKYPCLFIRKNTAKGPQRDKIVSESQRRIEEFERMYQPKFDDLVADWEGI